MNRVIVGALIALVVAVGGLGWALKRSTTKNGELAVRLNEVTQTLTTVIERQDRLDASRIELARAVAKLDERRTTVIQRIATVPSVPEEKTIAPVLAETLKSIREDEQ